MMMMMMVAVVVIDGGDDDDDGIEECNNTYNATMIVSLLEGAQYTCS